MTLVENKVNVIVKLAFEKAGYGSELSGVKSSTHADFQCNDALPLAKKEGKNPREVTTSVVPLLTDNDVIESAEIAGPGFINLTLTNDFLSSSVETIDADEKHGFAKEDTVKKVVVDYGGPNMAKVMHVGHLRSFVIGQSVKTIENFCGNETIGDIHLGDWGTPIGKIICELKNAEPNLSYFDENITDGYPEESPVDVDALGALYVKGNVRCKDDESAADAARQATAELQSGRPGYIALWKHFREISVNDIKDLIQMIDVDFDLWNGESDAQDILDNDLMAKLEPYTEMSEGAEIISLKEFETNKDIPPALIVKSGGGYTYHSSDIADIYRRKNEYKAEEIIYFADKRQSLHFEQVFLASRKAKIVSEDFPMSFAGFGMVNGQDGKPFKTRDGNVPTLRSLLEEALNKAKSILPIPGEEHSEEEINKLAKQISVGALKFNDMKNPRTSDYVFDMDGAMSFEGKTGPYMQYAVARINSILDKTNGLSLDAKIIIKEKEERSLALQIDAFAKAINMAYDKKDPYFIADYSYELAKSFSSFYTACPILASEDESVKLSRLHLAKCVKDIITTSLNLLGIECPHKMLRR